MPTDIQGPNRSRGTSPTQLEIWAVFSFSAMLQHISRGRTTRALVPLRILSPALTFPKVTQLCPDVLRPPQPAVRHSLNAVVCVGSKELISGECSSAPKLQRCYSPKCRDRRHAIKAGKFKCWAWCCGIYIGKNTRLSNLSPSEVGIRGVIFLRNL